MDNGWAVRKRVKKHRGAVLEEKEKLHIVRGYWERGFHCLSYDW